MRDSARGNFEGIIHADSTRRALQRKGGGGSDFEALSLSLSLSLSFSFLAVAERLPQRSLLALMDRVQWEQKRRGKERQVKSHSPSLIPSCYLMWDEGHSGVACQGEKGSVGCLCIAAYSTGLGKRVVPGLREFCLLTPPGRRAQVHAT